ncbi:hypothetical protein [Nocardioides caricicola]|uniref:Collagen-like protein n=1 Tax=Nocardioides caricicola TaxID=634770 RepID=A0ABW0N6S5_9ACTN
MAVGAIALTLVVVATSGAVAGALITSKDIKDNTIKSRDIRNGTIRTADIQSGAVTWEDSLSQATKDLIEGLAQSGAAGPPGPAGAPGPAGPSGANGTGALTGWKVYDAPTGSTAPLSITNPLYAVCAESYENPEDVAEFCGDETLVLDLPRTQPASGNLSLAAGSYLVTLRTLSPTLGVWVPQLSTDSGLASLTGSMGVCLSLFVPCETTFPVVVPSGGAELNLYTGDILGALGGLCGCELETADPMASLSVVSVATGPGVTAPSAPNFQQVVDALVGEITALITGIVPDGPLPKRSFPKALRTLERQYLN